MVRGQSDFFDIIQAVSAIYNKLNIEFTDTCTCISQLNCTS